MGDGMGEGYDCRVYMSRMCTGTVALKPVFVYRGSSPQVVVGTSTLEKKNKDLNRATKELEAKMRNLQQRTESDKVGHTHTLIPSTWVLPPVFWAPFPGLQYSVER